VEPLHEFIVGRWRSQRHGTSSQGQFLRAFRAAKQELLKCYDHRDGVTPASRIRYAPRRATEDYDKFRKFMFSMR
jgi:hypothetical protein